jgi:hypothetical protein
MQKEIELHQHGILYTREHLKSDNPPKVDYLSIDLRVTLQLNTEPDALRFSIQGCKECEFC